MGIKFDPADKQYEVVAALIWSVCFVEEKTDEELAQILLERCSSLYGDLSPKDLKDLVWRMRQGFVNRTPPPKIELHL